MSSDQFTKTRISKFLSSYNVGSRREVEKMIEEGRVHLNGVKLSSPVHFVNEKDSIKVDGKLVVFKKYKQIYKFYKPQGYICSKQKQDDRAVVYEILPKQFKNFIFAGRLDINSEGLLIVTNSGEISRSLELPKNEFIRKYKVRVYGILDEKKLKTLSQGTTIDDRQSQGSPQNRLSRTRRQNHVPSSGRKGKTPRPGDGSCQSAGNNEGLRLLR